MDEVKFVLKCLAFSAVLLLVMQIQVDGVTIESRFQETLVNPQMAEFVNNVAHGGVKLARDGYTKAVDFYKSKRGPDAEAELESEKTEASPKKTKQKKNKSSNKDLIDETELSESDEMIE